LVGLTVVAVWQGPRPQAFEDPAVLTSTAWWAYPVEWNAPERLPRVNGDLWDVTVQPGTGRVWVVGGGGLVLHSDDDGATWTQDTLAQQVLTAPVPADQAEGGEEDCVDYDPTALSLSTNYGGPVTLRAGTTVLFRFPASVDAGAVRTLARAHTRVCFLGRDTDQSPVFTPEVVAYWRGAADPAATATLACPAVSYDPATVRIVQDGEVWNLVAWGARREHVLRTVASRDVAERLLVVARRNTTACAPETKGLPPARRPSGFERPEGEQSAPTKEAMEAAGAAGADASPREGQRRPGLPVRTAAYDDGAQEAPSQKRDDPQSAFPEASVGLDAWRWPAGTPRLQTVVFADEERGWITGPGVGLQTTDGGATWHHAMGDLPRELAFVPRIEISGDVAVQDPGSGTIRALTSTAPQTEAEWSPSRRASALQSETLPIDTRGGWMMAAAVHETESALWALFREGEGAFLARQADDPSESLVAQTARLPDSVRTLHDLHFPDAQTGWVVGDSGTVLRTDDGGEAWAQVPVETSADLYSISFATATTGWIAGAEGTLLRTADGGATWQPALRPAGEVRAVHASAGGWAVLTGSDESRNAEVWASDDGATWQRRGRFDTTAVVDVRLTGEREGLALDDRGRVWQQPTPADPWLPLRTASLAVDGGGPTRVASLPPIGAISGDGRANLWLVAREGGRVLHSPDRGQTWRRLAVPILDAVRPRRAAFADATSGYLVGRSRADSTLVVHRTSDAGASWQVVSASGNGLPTTATIEALAVSGPETVWLATSRGVFVGSDGGQSWQPAPETAATPVRALAFEDPRTGVMVSAAGAAWRTTNAGRSWATHDLIPYHRWPAPWYYVVLAAIGAVVAWRVQRTDWTDEKPAETESVADLLMSDRPLRQGDPDALDLSSIARGLSRFMRNDRTEPPLTVAVTGAWGSGKSSLMNLLRANLRTFGFRPVWFNAWHHQKEEHLLAALLENVRQQGLPPILSRAGLRFRLRLFGRRMRGRLAAMVGWMSVLGAVALFAYQSNALGPAWASLMDVSNGGREIPAWTTLAEGIVAAVIGGGAALKVARLLGQALIAFGVTPAALMASLGSNARVQDLRAQTSFRYRFQQEFREVTEALQPRAMVIFIDDLDRCRPSNVLDLLEAVNFLVDSGDCFVVMGLDLDRVQQYVEQGFSEVDEEGFAEHYLEKLINIEVPVPRADEDDLYAVIRPEDGARREEPMPGAETIAEDDEEAEAEEIERRRQERAYRVRVAQVQQAFRRAKWAATALLIVLVGWGSGEIAASFFNPGSEDPTPTVFSTSEASPENPPESGDGAGGTGEATGPSGDIGQGGTAFEGQDAPVVEGGTAIRVQPGDRPPSPTSPAGMGWLVIPLGVLGAGGAWLLWVVLQPRGVVVHDSPEFETALEIWKSVLVRRIATPRAMKRFMNRVRYYAMHVRPPGPPETVAHRIAALLTPPPDAFDEREPLNEHVLVAACALQVAGHLPVLLDAPAEGDGAPPPAALSSDVRDAYEAHEETLGPLQSATQSWQSKLETLFTRLEST